MVLHSLLIDNLRIINNLELNCSEQVNLFTGNNGAGKTSILEAIDILSRGYSFRSRRLQTLLTKDSDALTVSGYVGCENQKIHLGIQKTAKENQLHFNHERVASISKHAAYLPVVAMHPDSHELIQGGSKQRRKYLDWSTFHVKHGYLKDWRDYNKCLKQRNMALKHGNIEGSQMSAWTEELCFLGERLNFARSAIFGEISSIFDEFIHILLPECKISWAYDKGWSENLGLKEALEEKRAQEMARRVTACGPHRADIRIFINGQEAAKAASRGQQKLLAASLLLTQIDHLKRALSKSCVVLLDDIRAELDIEHCDVLMQQIQRLNCQLFITAIDDQQLDLSSWSELNMFHVKQGRCELLA